MTFHSPDPNIQPLQLALRSQLLAYLVAFTYLSFISIIYPNLILLVLLILPVLLHHLHHLILNIFIVINNQVNFLIDNYYHHHHHYSFLGYRYHQNKHSSFVRDQKKNCYRYHRPLADLLKFKFLFKFKFFNN